MLLPFNTPHPATSTTEEPCREFVSVIMPCYNHAGFVIDSAKAVLCQTHPDLELIIVDDCSIDDSWERICELARNDVRVRPIRHERNLGASRSRNDALRIAKGEFIAFCDADDIWEREKLALQVKLLGENPDYDVIYSETLLIDETGRLTGHRFSEEFPPPRRHSGWLFEELAVRNFINIQSVLMRRRCVSRTAYFDEKIKWVEDWWYWIGLSRYHRFLYLKEPLARYRVHSRSTGAVQKPGYRANRFKVFKRVIRKYGDLSASAKAEIAYRMGADLCNLGRYRAGCRLFWCAIGASLGDPRAYGKLCKMMPRIVQIVWGYSTAGRQVIRSPFF